MKYLDLVFRGGVMMWPVLVTLAVVVVTAVDRILALRKVETDPSALLARSVGRRPVGEQEMREKLDLLKRDEAYRLGRRLALLSVSAILAPLLGILGTLEGMIVALRAVELHPLTAGGGVLAARLWAALLPAALGLAVGIPAYAMHAFLAARIERAGRDLDRAVRTALEGMREAPEVPPVDHRRPLVPAPRPAMHEEDEFFRKKVASASR